MMLPGPAGSHWRPGENMPASRLASRTDIWNDAGWQLLGNMIVNFQQLSVEALCLLAQELENRMPQAGVACILVRHSRGQDDLLVSLLSGKI